MAITAADVKAFAPEFASVADGIIDTWIGWASGYATAGVLGTDANQGQLLWVCHCLTRSVGGNAVTGGAVTKEQVGPATRETASPTGALAQLTWGATFYGQQLLDLARRYTAGGFIV